MNLGNLKNRVIVESRATNTDAVGGQSTQWVRTDPYEIWAGIDNLSGRELEAAQAVNAEASKEVTIRYLPYLTSACRLIYTNPAGVQVYLYLVEPPRDYNYAHEYMQFLVSEGMQNS